MTDLLKRLANSRDDCESEGADYIARLLDEAIVEIECLRAIVAATAQMRAAQKAYFRDRKQGDLIASKKLERDVDDRLEKLKRGGVNGTPRQTPLL